MTDWIKWDGGECPIPEAKAGEYRLRLHEGKVITPRCSHALDYNWGKGGYTDIIAYRFIEKEQSDLDWLEGLIQVEFDHQNAKQPNYTNISAREAYRTVLDLIKVRKEAKS